MMGKDKAELRKEILAIKDWRHPFEIEPGVWVELLFDWFKEWHEWRVRQLMPHVERIVGACVHGGMRYATVLDVGCWDGYYGFELLKRGARYLKGIDVREQNLKQAILMKEYFGYEHCDFQVADIQDVVFGEEKYDVVLLNGILYHLSNPIDVLKALGDACGSVMVISTYTTNDRQADLRLKWDNPQKLSMGNKELVTIPSESALIEMLHWAGCTTILRDIPYPFYHRYRDAGFGFYYALKGMDDERTRQLLAALRAREQYDPKLHDSQIVCLAPAAEPATRLLEETPKQPFLKKARAYFATRLRKRKKKETPE